MIDLQLQRRGAQDRELDRLSGLPSLLHTAHRIRTTDLAVGGFGGQRRTYTYIDTYIHRRTDRK